MTRVVFTLDARIDILAISSRIAADNPDAADRWLDRIVDACSRLEFAPHTGRPETTCDEAFGASS